MQSPWKAKFTLWLLFFSGLWGTASPVSANPWNGKVVLQAFWWDCLNQRYATSPDGTGGWYRYLTKLAPRLRRMGFDGIWVPPPCKAKTSHGMGYDLFDHYDLGNKMQMGSTGTRFGDQDAFLRLIAVAHANGLEVYPDIVLNHMDGGIEDPVAPGNKHKNFHYASFSGLGNGRWPKSWLDFHPNPHHSDADDDWRHKLVGVDICYHGRCCDNDCAHAGTYMRDEARNCFVWFKRQTDVDGFRFDAVKHFPPEVVEDLLFNAMDKGKPEAQQRQYFAVGEFVVDSAGAPQLDGWAQETKNRCGAFDYAFRSSLSDIVTKRGFFDMGKLPDLQQKNRFKTVPFLNNHDTWRGVFPDSGGNGQTGHTGTFQNGDELAPTIDPDSPWAKIACAAAMAVDGSPQLFYEDLFKNESAPNRLNADPQSQPTRSYVENLVWCHQKLRFKDGAYKVRFRNSPDLLVIERSAHAIIALNDNGVTAQSATIDTDFGPNVELHDYSGSSPNNLRTDAGGRLTLTTPPLSYSVWARTGITGVPTTVTRRTTQEFQLDDDLGDKQNTSPGYGGKCDSETFHVGGAVWIAQGTLVKVWAYTDTPNTLALRLCLPQPNGNKALDQGQQMVQGTAAPGSPLLLQFTAPREGYYQLAAKLNQPHQTPVRAYLKINYQAPTTSAKF